jgi:hypothetical protein
MVLKIEQVEYAGWKQAYRLTLGAAEMIVVAEIGPRILSLRVGGGPNLLFVDEETLGKGRGDKVWHIYGGHRIWVSPESELAYAPDNGPCKVTVEPGKLTIQTSPDATTRLVRRLTISAEGERFAVESAAKNTSAFVFPGAIWCLTCVAPAGVIAFPWGGGGSWAVKRISHWVQWAEHTSDVRSKQYRPGPDLYNIHPTGEEGKVGTHSPEGWLALCRPDATFIKQFEPNMAACYPDGGCSVEVYTCPRFIEMETLGPLGVIGPGEEIAQREWWTLSPKAVDPEDGAALRALLR